MFKLFGYRLLYLDSIEYYLKNKEDLVCFESVYYCILWFITFVFLNNLSNEFNILYYYWIEPSLIGQIFLRIYLIAEHNGCQIGTNMWQNTRSTKTYFFHCYLAWNMPYHLEHHAFPFVPFYLLPKLHKTIANNLAKSKMQTTNHNNSNGSNGEKLFYSKSECNPNGSQGYISVHQRLWKQFF